MGQKGGDTILLEVPPGAISHSESVDVHSAVIPDGPFTLPDGYQLGSMVLYIHYDRRCVTHPISLHFPHWYGGDDYLRDGLSFAMASHTLQEGESVYHLELLDGGRFAEQRQCGVLQLSYHCALLAVVFKVEASSLYYASLWSHNVDGGEISKTESKIVITYADPVWLEVGIIVPMIYGFAGNVHLHGMQSADSMCNFCLTIANGGSLSSATISRSL